MQNLVRNMCSNILELDLTHNLIEYEEFAGMFTKCNIDSDSCFGNLHFKLRILNLFNNPMKDFAFKINKKLKEYHSSNFQKLLICTSND